MLQRKMWLELRPHWIEWGNWDEGLRALPASIMKNRVCICPELSRNKNIGENGVNMHAEWFRNSFSTLAWSERVHDFGNLSYLLEANYESHVRLLVARATQLHANFQESDIFPSCTYLLIFNKTTWSSVVNRLDIWGSGGLRGAYKQLAIIPYR